MKVMITKRQAEWISDNVAPMMNFDEVVEFGNVMYKFTRGYMATYISDDLLKRVIQLCIDNNFIHYSMFYAFCAKMHKIQNVKVKEEEKYCIRFDANSPYKIPSIKAMRDIVKNEVFIELEKGVRYYNGLKEMKEAVEDGIVLGPYNKDQVRTLKTLLAGSPYFVEEYTGQKTLKDVQF